MQKLLAQIAGLFLMALLITLCVSAVGSNALLQGKASDLSPRKIDDFDFLDTDSEGARLDAFSLELQKEPGARGYIISYNESDVPPGRFLRRIYGDKRYLVENRALKPDHLIVVNGGYREKFRTELWLVPDGALPPKPTPTVFNISDKLPLKFDHECLICEPAVFIDQLIFVEGLHYYAEALRARPNSRARIVIHTNNPRETNKDLALARSILIKKHQIEPGRITTMKSKRLNSAGAIEFWIL